MIFGKGYMEYDLFFTCAATVAMTKCMKKDYKKIAERLDETYSKNFLDKNLKKDFIKAGDDLYKRIKKVKYKNDKERALVLQNYSNSVSEPGRKKLFGGTAFNKLKSPAKNKSKETIKSFNTWLQNAYVADAFNKAFSGDY
tara:strand:+ start:101 stop:523 length:423 start_codon:yes stop_codon:yes gene_type:complete